MVGEQCWIYTSTLRVSLFSPLFTSLRGIVVYYSTLISEMLVFFYFSTQRKKKLPDSLNIQFSQKAMALKTAKACKRGEF